MKALIQSLFDYSFFILPSSNREALQRRMNIALKHSQRLKKDHPTNELKELREYIDLESRMKNMGEKYYKKRHDIPMIKRYLNNYKNNRNSINNRT
jgi:hypothetical protein